jgi:hypothetical protein
LPSLTEAIAADIDALADYLATSLPDATVSSGALEEIPAEDYIVLDTVTIPQGNTGYQGREGRPQVAGVVIVQRPEGGEPAIRATRRAAAALMGKVEAAITAVNKNPAAAGMTAVIGTVTLATSGLLGSPSMWKGQASRQAQVSFTVSWMSHSS